MDDGYPIIGIVIVLSLLMLKALISYGAKAIEQINEMAVRKKSEEGDEKSRILLKLIEQPDSYVNAVEDRKSVV